MEGIVKSARGKGQTEGKRIHRSHVVTICERPSGP